MKARTFLLALGFFALCLGAPASAFAIELNAQEKAALAEGKVVRRIIADNGKDRYYGGTGMAVIQAPPEAVWAAIQDFPSYPKMFSNTYETTELSRLGGKSLVRMKLGHPIVSVQYHVEMTPERASWTLNFRLVNTYANDLEDIRGYWRLVPLGKDTTLLMYVVGVKVPDGIVRLLPDAFKRWALDGVLGAPLAIKNWMAAKPAKEPVSPSP